MNDSNSELEDFDSFQTEPDDEVEQTAKDPDADYPLPPQPGEDDPTKAVNQPDAGSRTPGRGVPDLRNSRSEHDRTIRPGDPVRDLWGQSWLVVVEKAADSVAEYDRQQSDTQPSLLSYEGSIGVGATEEDSVWACFYLNQNNTLAGGRNGPYDFPESRICRYAYEATDGYKRGRFQEHIQMQVLEQMVQVVRGYDPDFHDEIHALLVEAFDKSTADEAFELAEAAQGDHSA